MNLWPWRQRIPRPCLPDPELMENERQQAAQGVRRQRILDEVKRLQAIRLLGHEGDLERRDVS